MQRNINKYNLEYQYYSFTHIYNTIIIILWTTYDKMQHSIHCIPVGRSRKQTIGIILSQGKGRREYGAQQLKLPYLLFS